MNQRVKTYTPPSKVERIMTGNAVLIRGTHNRLGYRHLWKLVTRSTDLIRGPRVNVLNRSTAAPQSV